MNKAQLRNEVLRKISQLSKEEKILKTEKIHQQLLLQEKWQEASIIGMTISTPKEIDTYRLIEKAWEHGKTVVVPKCIHKEKKLIFYAITSFEQLEVSYFNLKEPIPAKTKEVDSTMIDFLIVPGVVFDRNGYRIGFGGGYYDRFLSGKSLQTCSLCFTEQLIEKVPREEHDIPVNSIITEKETLSTWT